MDEQGASKSINANDLKSDTVRRAVQPSHFIRFSSVVGEGFVRGEIGVAEAGPVVGEINDDGDRLPFREFRITVSSLSWPSTITVQRQVAAEFGGPDLSDPIELWVLPEYVQSFAHAVSALVDIQGTAKDSQAESSCLQRIRGAELTLILEENSRRKALEPQQQRTASEQRGQAVFGNKTSKPSDVPSGPPIDTRSNDGR